MAQDYPKNMTPDKPAATPETRIALRPDYSWAAVPRERTNYLATLGGYSAQQLPTNAAHTSETRIALRPDYSLNAVQESERKYITAIGGYMAATPASPNSLPTLRQPHDVVPYEKPETGLSVINSDGTIATTTASLPALYKPHAVALTQTTSQLWPYSIIVHDDARNGAKWTPDSADFERELVPQGSKLIGSDSSKNGEGPQDKSGLGDIYEKMKSGIDNLDFGNQALTSPGRGGGDWGDNFPGLNSGLLGITSWATILSGVAAAVNPAFAALAVSSTIVTAVAIWTESRKELHHIDNLHARQMLTLNQTMLTELGPSWSIKNENSASVGGGQQYTSPHDPGVGDDPDAPRRSNRVRWGNTHGAPANKTLVSG